MNNLVSAIPKNSSLYNCLTEVKLDKFYENLVRKGVTTCEKLASISILDFESYGVTGMNDRLRLFQLIQVIKSVILKNLNLEIKGHFKSRKRQMPRVVSDDSLTHKSKSFTNVFMSNKVQLESIQNLEDETSELLINEKRRIPILSASEVTIRVQDMDNLNCEGNGLQSDQQNLFQSNGLNNSLTDEYRSKTFKSLSRPIQKSCLQCHTVKDRNAKLNINFSKAIPALFHGIKALKKDKMSEAEKASFIKETLYSGGYDYGVPLNKMIIKNKEKAKRDPGGFDGQLNQDKVKVCIRKRPRNIKEISANDPDIIHIEGKNRVIVEEQKTALNLSKYIHQHILTFDEAFDETKSNMDVYTSTVKPLVTFILKKGSAICFSFGQTGAGKTHTLIGDKNNPGLYHLAGKDIFDFIQLGGDANVWVSFYEIYCGQLFDLLNNRKKLVLMEKNNKQVCVTGLMETCATDLRSLIHIINFGRIHRSKGCSGVNPVSSRSHAILQLDVRSTTTNKRVGRLTFIDLAGSERASDAMKCNKQTRYEGAEINQSLLALKECIRSLDQEQSHTPYRQSKLTHILRESFSGNCQTVMIANVSPTLSACENTLNTLRYAARVQELKKASQQKVKLSARKLKDAENCLVESTSPPSPISKDQPPNPEEQNRNINPLLNLDAICGTPRISSPDAGFSSSSTRGMSSMSSQCSQSTRFAVKIKERNINLCQVDVRLKNDHHSSSSSNSCQKPKHCQKTQVATPQNYKSLAPKNEIEANFNLSIGRKKQSSQGSCSIPPGHSENSEKNDKKISTPDKEHFVFPNLLCMNARAFQEKSLVCRAKEQKDKQTIVLLRSTQTTRANQANAVAQRSSKKDDASTNLEVEKAVKKAHSPEKISKKSEMEKSNEPTTAALTRSEKESDAFEDLDLALPFQDALEDHPNVSNASNSGHKRSHCECSLDANSSDVAQNKHSPACSLNNENSLINAHEKHLDSVTQLCREEIDLLMKLRSGQMPFPSYVSKIRGIMATRKIMSDALIDHIGQFENYLNNNKAPS